MTKIDPEKLGEKLYKAHISLLELLENNTGKLIRLFLKGDKETAHAVIKAFEIAAERARKRKIRNLEKMFKTYAKILRLVNSAHKEQKIDINKELEELYGFFLKKFGKELSIEFSYSLILNKPEEILNAAKELGVFLNKLIKFVVYETRRIMNNVKNNRCKVQFKHIINKCYYFLRIVNDFCSDLEDLTEEKRLKLTNTRLYEDLLDLSGILNGLIGFMESVEEFLESFSQVKQA